jgi:C1A family cysteine protease
VRVRTRGAVAATILISIVLFILCMTPVLGRQADANSVAAATKLKVSGDGKHYTGLQRSSGTRAKKLTLPLSAEPLSASVDLSAQLPPVGNQGAQGSCVAWATSYYYKSWSEKQEHTTWNLSNTYYQYSPSFMYNQINGGHDNGATFENAFALLQSKGDVDIAEMPYNQNNYTLKPTTAQLEAAKPYQIPSDWDYFWFHQVNGPYSSPNDISRVKTILSSGEVLVMGIPVYKDFPDYGSNPSKTYYDYNGTSGLAGGHGVCICGYDDNINTSGSDADHKGGFKMVNSWGSSWNGSGYVYLSYDFVKRYAWEAWAMSDKAPDDPVISSVSPASGVAGTSVTITGDNFGTLRRSAKVSFNGVNATQVSFSNTSVTAQVPVGATSGPLRVYDWDGKASNSTAFTVISGFGVASIKPASAANTGSVSVQISGAGFKAGTGAGARLEQGTATVINATNFVVSSDTMITCTFNIASQPLGKYDVVVRNADGAEARLTGGFSVTNVCGQGGGASISVLAAVFGLVSMAGLGLRKRNRSALR